MSKQGERIRLQPVTTKVLSIDNFVIANLLANHGRRCLHQCKSDRPSHGCTVNHRRWIQRMAAINMPTLPGEGLCTIRRFVSVSSLLFSRSSIFFLWFPQICSSLFAISLFLRRTRVDREAIYRSSMAWSCFRDGGVFTGSVPRPVVRAASLGSGLLWSCVPSYDDRTGGGWTSHDRSQRDLQDCSSEWSLFFETMVRNLHEDFDRVQRRRFGTKDYGAVLFKNPFLLSCWICFFLGGGMIF